MDFALPTPWDALSVWPIGRTVALRGASCVGKSSLAMLLEPALWLTNDMNPDAVVEMFERVRPGHFPEIFAVQSDADVREVLEGFPGGLVVVDAVSQFGYSAPMISMILNEWAERTDGRALGILNEARSGSPKYTGYSFDVLATVKRIRDGHGSFEVNLNRHAPLVMNGWSFEAIGWDFDEEGRIVTSS